MPVYNVELKWLEKAIQSVRQQTYTYWELCIADDASTKPEIREYLEKIQDKRIRVRFLEKNQGIVGASNAAAEMARGDYIILMDDDDELYPNALYEVYRDLLRTDANMFTLIWICWMRKSII